MWCPRRSARRVSSAITPPQPAAVLGRDPRRENVHGFELVVFERRSERDGTVVVEGHPIDDVLGVVFRTSRVEDGVGLQQPAGQGGHDIDGAASQSRSGCAIQAEPPHLHGIGGLQRIQQRRRIFDRQFLVERSDLQDDLKGLRDCRADLHSPGQIFETGMGYREPVLAGAQALEDGMARFVGRHSRDEFRAPAHELDQGRDRAAAGIGHPDRQAPLHDLSERRRKQSEGCRGKQ